MNRQQADFPSAARMGNFFNVLKWGHWEGRGIVRLFFYLGLVITILNAILLIVVSVFYGGAWIFFGILLSLIHVVCFPMLFRIMSEMFLSVFSVRDNIYKLSNTQV